MFIFLVINGIEIKTLGENVPLQEVNIHPNGVVVAVETLSIHGQRWRRSWSLGNGRRQRCLALLLLGTASAGWWLLWKVALPARFQQAVVQRSASPHKGWRRFGVVCGGGSSTIGVVHGDAPTKALVGCGRQTQSTRGEFGFAGGIQEFLDAASGGRRHHSKGLVDGGRPRSTLGFGGSGCQIEFLVVGDGSLGHAGWHNGGLSLGGSHFGMGF